MDAKVEAAPMTPAVRHQLRFEGSGGEYFKIWIVNLALSIVTLGIFSAWAKVRSKRYFYGNTYIGTYSFDYHASPLRILLGRAIAVGVLLIYSLTAAFVPWLTFVFGIAFFFGMPWLVNAALRFNARNSSYRNVRFNFVGTYGDAFTAYIGWAFLTAVTLFTTYPLARRARLRFHINNHRFGGRPFAVEIAGRAMYSAYLIGVLIMVPVITLVVAVALAKEGQQHQPGIEALLGGLAVIAAFCVLILVGTRVFNLAINGTTLASRYSFESSLSPLRMIWLGFSNLLLMLVTLGLFYPWAQVRMTRYIVSRLAVTGPADLEGFTSELVAQQGAIGEEVANFLDVDVGL